MKIRYDGPNELPDYLTKGKEYLVVSRDTVFGAEHVKIVDDVGDVVELRLLDSYTLGYDDWTIIDEDTEEQKMSNVDVGFEFVGTFKVKGFDANNSKYFVKVSTTTGYDWMWVDLDILHKTCRDEATYNLFVQKHKEMFPELYKAEEQESPKEDTIAKLKAALNKAIDEGDMVGVETYSKAIQRMNGVTV